MNTHDYFEVAVAEVIQKTPDAISISFDIPLELQGLFSYQSGQFVTLRVSVAGKIRHRCYSLCSAPGLDARPTIAIKRVDGGLVSNMLCSDVAAGTRLSVQPPAGHFVPPRFDGDFVLAAGGSGITPILSIIKSALAHGSGKIFLIYANRDEKSVIFSDDIIQLMNAHPDRFTAYHWLESVQGLPATVNLAALLSGWSDAQMFICGPAPFMEAASRAGEAAGLADDRIHLEKFVSLPDEPDDDDATAASGTAMASELTVSLDGKEHRVQWSAGKKLLDAMLDAGLDAPYSCKVGGCSACMCRVLEGCVTMGESLILSQQERDEGWTLACQAVAASPTVHIEIL